MENYDVVWYVLSVAGFVLAMAVFAYFDGDGSKTAKRRRFGRLIPA